MKIFLITCGAFVLGYVASELQASFGKVNVPIMNNLLWATAFALIAAGLCL